MNICVFGASGSKLHRDYLDAARQAGQLLAQAGHSLVFGGGQEGLMGACAEGVASRGGMIIGVAPRFFDQPGVLFQGCGDLILTETMRERKAKMEELADAFLVLPGGIGTLEEFFEVLTLCSLGVLRKPVVLLNTRNYYTPMAEFLREAVSQGFVGESSLSLFSLCDRPESALQMITQLSRQGHLRRNLQDYNR